LLNWLNQRPRRTETDRTQEAEARARQIDELMAGPVRDRPAITVVGDDEVFGLYPITRT
jgi:hypothetical protein